MQLSAVPVPVTYTPIQPVPPIGAVKGRDANQPDSSGESQRLRATPPPGVGTLFDLTA